MAGLRVAGLAAMTLVLVGIPAAAWAQEGTGSISGHITKDEPGTVKVNLWTTGGGSAGQVISNENGDYTFAGVTPGDYKVQFDFEGRFEWAYQKLGFSTASVITVSSGAVSTVDETLLKPGAVEIVATDAVTGQPVDNYCVGGPFSAQQCGATGGVMRLAQYDGQAINIQSSDGLHARTTHPAVSVVLGQITRVEVRLDPTAAISTTVVDRVTGAPVPSICVAAVPLNFGHFAKDPCAWDSGSFSDDNGQVRLGELGAGEYTLLVLPDDYAHGIQWAGRNGGTGSQYSALKISATAGQLSAGPQIKLDGLAAISGVVTDAATGEPMSNACASVLPFRPGAANAMGTFSCDHMVGGSGTYALDKLGPYAWPVEFSNFYDYIDPWARVWSGSVTDRKAATLITAGSTPTVLNMTLSQVGPRIDIQAVYPDGSSYGSGSLTVDVYNAKTGDFVKSVSFGFGERNIGGLLDQNVKLRWSAGSYPNWGSGWVGGATFASAKTFKLVGGNRIIAKIIIPTDVD